MKQIILGLISFLLFSDNAVRAIQINEYDPQRHDRFLSGTNRENPSFFAAGYDFSGVGWNSVNSNQCVTMVSPLHFVGANHYRIPVGSNVLFVNREGMLKSYTVAGYDELTSVDGSGQTQTADLVLGRLAAAISAVDDIAFYRVLDTDLSFYVGKEFLPYGWTHRVGRDTFGGANDRFALANSGANNATVSMVYDYHKVNTSAYPDEAGLQGGDSGSPTLMAWNNELTVLGTHFAVDDSNPTYRLNIDSFLPYYIPQLNAKMAPSGYSISTLAVVPEPASIVLFLSGLIGIAFRSRRSS
ncbi:MAG: PEP-CTERM sorting domain-containing protein [Candidatus Omnitrophica bacterium]|nr:PEP-CTERM sorting domain-containing protein [Candidatus Omnitrophota bacterium]